MTDHPAAQDEAAFLGDQLQKAERWARDWSAVHPAVSRAWLDLLMSEYDRRYAKLCAIHGLLPRLNEHLPADLRGELAAHLYVWPSAPLTAADIRHGQRVAAELASGVQSDASEPSRGQS